MNLSKKLQQEAKKLKANGALTNGKPAHKVSKK